MSVTSARSSFAFPFILCILFPNAIYFGLCSNLTFSICWKISNWPEGTIRLNHNDLTSIRRPDAFLSLTVATNVEHNLTLQYGGGVHEWNFSILPSSNTIKLISKQKPEEQPDSILEDLNSFSANEVFACENSPLYLYQDQHFVLMLGHTARHPLKLESRTTFMLLVSWKNVLPPAVAGPAHSHSVSLYQSEMKAYVALGVDSTRSNHYRFTALESCTPYVACVKIDGSHSVTCISTITEPEVPRHFHVTVRDPSSLTVSWECPDNCKFSLFLVTVFYLNGTNHVLEERSYRHTLVTFVFTQSNLTLCSRVKFGLQTVCKAGNETRFSRMVFVDGNTVQSEIEDLRQTGSGPDNYTLTWMVRNTTSVTAFRIHHQGALHTTTQLTSHTVTGLQPCTQYPARVEAFCEENVMSAKTVLARTGPRGVSELSYRSMDSTALWTAGTGTSVSFHYRLAYANGSTIRTGQLVEPWLHLPGLTEATPYTLDVWEDCDGEWSADPALVCFDGANVPANLEVQPVVSSFSTDKDPGLMFDIAGPSMVVVVPWSLGVDLQDPKTEPRAELERVVTNRLKKLLEGYRGKISVRSVAFEDLEGEWKTRITFQVSDASTINKNGLLPTEVQLEHIQSQQCRNITVNDGVIYWDDPDECASPDLNNCDPGTLCINTLDSYTCVCPHGFYDVNPVLNPSNPSSNPVCRERGIYAQCLDGLMVGGIAKAFLIGHFGGNVTTVLNAGQCRMNESEAFYHFRMLRTPTQCGTRRLVNRTDFEFRNILKVTLRKDEVITRRDLKIVWKCVYPRSYIHNTQINLEMEWITSHSARQYNASHELGLAMAMYNDDTFSHSYRDAVTLGYSDVLFFEVALITNNTFASEVLLEVVSCWATESPDPQDETKGIFLQNSCPADITFEWLSLNGAAPISRFSVQMFALPRELPIYIHCMAQICAHNEDCTKDCGTQRVSKRSITKRRKETRQSAVVSVGPLTITREETRSNWEELVMMTVVVGGSICILMLTVLGVSVTKAIINYYMRAKP
ncbi:hypothetical protein DPEC_G00115810 [Dallia pectoralis]|uniref:Uncharacterized protein n=1 Tax=Dallia pectoralis TaxID=75939 RepID=A0ACC2GUF2_DALPE|nr:hypothetical protein DPEC_G00115810 [Dallia pectoralis]